MITSPRGVFSFVVVIATAATITCTKRVSAFAFLRHQYQTRPCTRYTVAGKQLDRRLSAESPSSTTTMTTENDSAATASLPALAPTAKRLFYVRHGEVINPGGDRPVYYGALDVSLSALGKQEAKAAAEHLKEHADLDHVFSSPLKRAVYGATKVLKLQKEKPQDKESPSSLKEVVTFDGFKELDRGDWCGKTKAEIGEEMMARFDACDLSITPKNGESFPFLKNRVIEARDAALSRMSPGETGCVVSHLQVSRCIVSDAANIPVDQMVNVKIATASITCIDYDGDKQTVHYQSFKPDIGLRASNDHAN